MQSTKIRTDLIWRCGRYLNIGHLLCSPYKKLAKVSKKRNAYPRKIIDHLPACLSVGVLVEILHSSFFNCSSPPRLSFVNSQCSRKKKGRLTLAQWGGENIFIQLETHLLHHLSEALTSKGLLELWAGVLFSISKKPRTEANPHPACLLELIGQYL